MGRKQKSNGYFSLTQSSQHERGRLPGLIQPFVDQMRRGNVHVNASRKTFKNIYARFTIFIAWVKPKSEGLLQRYDAGCDQGCDATSGVRQKHLRAARPTENASETPAGRQADGNSPCPPAFKAKHHWNVRLIE